MENQQSTSNVDSMPPEVQRWIGWQLFERVPANIIVIDRNFEVIAANSRFVETFGEAVGKRCFQAYKQYDSPCKNCMAATTFRDGKVDLQKLEELVEYHVGAGTNGLVPCGTTGESGSSEALTAGHTAVSRSRSSSSLTNCGTSSRALVK